MGVIMSLLDITKQVNELTSVWQEFKRANEQRITEIETTGKANALTLEKLSTLNDIIDQCNIKIKKIEAAMSRPDLMSNESYIPDAEKKDFREYLYKGINRGAQQVEIQTKSSDYVLSRTITQNVMKSINNYSTFRKITSVDKISSYSMTYAYDNTPLNAIWIDYNKTIGNTPIDAKHNLSIITIPTHDLYTQLYISQNFLEDSEIDVEGWFTDKIAEAFAKKEDEAFLVGETKSNNPIGLLQAVGTRSTQIPTLKSGTSGTFDADALIKLYYTLPVEYTQNACFIMHRTTMQHVRLLKSKQTGQYLWQPGLDSERNSTIMGIPVYTLNHMPAMTKDSLSILVGDLKQAYKIVDRAEIRLLRDPFIAKPLIIFCATKRVGGGVVNARAAAAMILSA